MRPFTIVSLWDMIELAAENLLASTSNVCLFGAKIRQLLEKYDSNDPNVVVSVTHHFYLLEASIIDIANHASKIGMPVTLAAVSRCKQFYSEIQPHSQGFLTKRTSLNNLAEHLYQLSQVLSDEIKSHKVFVVDSKHSEFYGVETASFGDKVEAAFPSSEPEILEAGKCRALGRWTACVMHLMRALEPSLLALQSAVAVDVPKEQWDQIINQIEAKIREIKKSSHGGADEQWYSEAASHFRLIKNAWRNHAQHLHERYDEERAVAIYDSVRAFMRHLASRLAE